MSIAESKSTPTFGIEAESLRAMDQAASEIAHDIDNALAPISRCTADLLASEQLTERARFNLASIRRATDEVAHSVDRLREIYRPREAQSQPADTQSNPGAQSHARRLRVLLIDDDPTLIESLRSALTDEGHKVTSASGGHAGIEAFRTAQGGGMPFDIVITDLAMPDVDGRQVVGSLRDLSPRTPIIVLTGWQFQVTKDEQRALRVDRLLGKPPRIRELRAALAELTGRRATDRPG
ncbi:MAG TPA: response regulator [Steroidobacteraceae bacterium]|nr:response regulator [Steroidobacteraceae bacterium]